MREIIISTVGRLMGDTWMLLPIITKVSQLMNVKVVTGSYGHDAVLFTRNHVVGANFEIVDTVDDPDESTHPFCPGIGGPSIIAARQFLESKYPTDVILAENLASVYSVPAEYMKTNKSWWIREDRCVAVQPYTCHDWKNCDNVLTRIPWTVPSYLLGLPQENVIKPDDQIDLRATSFENQMVKLLSSYMVASVLSSWACAAAVFGKRQFVASFTSDVHSIRRNERASHLIEPTVEQVVECLRGDDVC